MPLTHSVPILKTTGPWSIFLFERKKAASIPSPRLASLNYRGAKAIKDQFWQDHC